MGGSPQFNGQWTSYKIPGLHEATVQVKMDQSVFNSDGLQYLQTSGISAEDLHPHDFWYYIISSSGSNHQGSIIIVFTAATPSTDDEQVLPNTRSVKASSPPHSEPLYKLHESGDL